jgi:hypothetical protein
VFGWWYGTLWAVIICKWMYMLVISHTTDWYDSLWMYLAGHMAHFGLLRHANES